MAGNIKGITIEFSGDTKQLDSAIREINKNTRSLDKELRAVDKALKFNPTSVELWRQKQELLTQKIEDTKSKLDLLKQKQAQMDAKGVDKNSEEYRKLQREIIETESKVKTFEGQLRKVGQVNLRAASEQFKQWGTSLESAGRQMTGLSKAAAAVAASIGALTVKSGKWADDVNTMSKKYSISTNDLQKYSAAADLVDVSTEDLAKSQQKLKKSMFSARDGGSSAEVFETLGVAVTDANGDLRDANDVFDDVIKSLGEMTNETERDALAQQILGKSAANLNPLIEDGGETYKRVADTLAKYNLDFISEEDLQNANKFNDELDTIKTIGLVAFQNIGTQLAGTLAPALEKVVEWVGKFAEWLGNLDPKLLTVLAGIAGVVAAVAPLLIGLGKLATGIGAVVKLFAVAGPALAALGPFILPIVGIVAAIVVAFKIWKKHGETIKKFFVDFGKKIAKVWDDIKVAVGKALEGTRAVITSVFNAIKTIITVAVTAYVAIIRTQFNIMKTVVTTVVNGIKLVVTTVFNAIKTIITTAVTAYVTLVRTQFELMKTVVTTAVNAIKTVVTTVFNAIKSTVTTIWNGIKTAITNPIQAAQSALSSIVNGIKSKVTGAFSGIAGSVRSAFNAVKNAITGPIEQAKGLVTAAVNKIKSIFPIKLGKIFSGVKLPHFKISGGRVPWGVGGQGVKPTVSIEWYKKAMSNPYMFSSPTVFGAGEAGDEILYGRNSLMKDIAAAVAAGGGGGPVINVYATPGMDVNDLANKIEQILVNKERQRLKAYGTI